MGNSGVLSTLEDAFVVIYSMFFSVSQRENSLCPLETRKSENFLTTNIVDDFLSIYINPFFR
jgi:hypothetical protein